MNTLILACIAGVAIAVAVNALAPEQSKVRRHVAIASLTVAIALVAYTAGVKP